MEKQKQILIRKNDYWLSEIGFLFFKYQVGYEVYDYSKDSKFVKKGIDLIVLNKQNIPTYILCCGNDYPFDKLFLPIVEEDKESRLLSSESDFAFFYDINKKSVCLIDLPLLQEKINYNFTKGAWKDYTLADKGTLKGIQVDKDDEVIKEALTEYTLHSDIFDKAVKIFDHRVDDMPLTQRTKHLPLSRAGAY